MLNAVYFIDFPSILCIVLIVFPVLAAAGLLKPFLASFSYIIRKTIPVPEKQLKTSLMAVNLVMSLVLCSGVLVTLVNWVVFLRNLDMFQYLAINLSVSIITLIYAVFLEILLLPVKVRLELKLNEAEGQKH